MLRAMAQTSSLTWFLSSSAEVKAEPGKMKCVRVKSGTLALMLGSLCSYEPVHKNCVGRDHALVSEMLKEFGGSGGLLTSVPVAV